ncbi:tetratricopeptide repeat protein [Phormidium tenue FACHB-886]|nr:tetratricopeptide repeat protein [Phormidium tenue FACHB-886]
MTSERPTQPASGFPIPSPVPFKRLGAAIAGTLTLTVSLWMNPAAADPFRANNPRAVGTKTETAFKTLFEQGNYREAERLLQSAETNEPLAYAMKAALAYVNQDFETMGRDATLTRETAEKLVQSDPLRGHLYIAAGHFLEGAHSLSTQSTIAATPAVLAKLQQVFDNLNEAEKIDPQDPELNLLKGFMDLMLAVNLPFSNPEQSIERLQNYAKPSYLAQRGIAIAYRDLEKPDEALAAVEQAIKETPGNPELFYLKAQILRLKSNKLQGTEQVSVRQDSVRSFRQAWRLRDRLPEELVRQLNREGCRTFQQSRNRNPDACNGTVNWQGNS